MALSYTWGSEGPTKPMQCGSQTMKITPNLHAALCEISLKAEVAGKWLWVDAVCIDQKNEGEKAVEVKRMNLIYTAAWRVLVWLGPADDDSDLAMDNLRGLTNIMTPLPSDEGDREAREKRLAPADHPVWTAIVKLYNRPWFRRLWIMQEVILAQGIFVLCGNRVLSWAAIVDFANAISVVYAAVLLQHGQQVDGATNGFVSCSQVENLRKRVPNGNVTFFTSLLETTRDREATDQRDRIYGLLGLITDDLRNLVKVDYTWPSSDCYLHFFKAFVTREPTLTILSMASSIQKAPSLPSWCPDLSSQRKETTLYSLNAGFKAGFHDRPSRHSTIKTSLHDNSISIPGCRVDVVKKVCHARYTSFPENKVQHGAIATQNLTWDTECLALFHETFPERGHDDFEAYSRTHIANHFDPTTPVPPTYALQNDYRNVKQFWVELSQGLESKIDTFAAKKAETRYVKAMELQQSRTFMVTEGGRMGLGPSEVRARDVVCVFDAAASLFVLRFAGKMNRGMLIGDAFVDGLMDLGKIPQVAKGANERFCVE
ncbi:MAG: hypothetical protein Q9182_007478 [Xanthomendoza sp. 2 TL-2023]